MGHLPLSALICPHFIRFCGRKWRYVVKSLNASGVREAIREANAGAGLH
jgi:hypothetical protein